MYFEPTTVLEVRGDINRLTEQYRKGDVVEVHYLGLKKCIGRINNIGVDKLELDISKQYSSNIVKIPYCDICNIIRYEEKE